jgi:hypothetical protein
MTQHRLQRIGFLSTRFVELHGFRTAVVGASLALVMGSYLVLTPTPSNNGALLALGLSFVPMAPGVWWANRYYSATFGRQVIKARNPGRLIAFGCAYWVIGFSLDKAFPAIPAGAPTAATVVLFASWVAVRDWPVRAYYLAAPAAVIAAFMVTASGGGVLTPNLTLVTIFFTLGVSIVVIGLLDHRLLVKLVEDAREVSAPSDPVACAPPERG